MSGRSKDKPHASAEQPSGDETAFQYQERKRFIDYLKGQRSKVYTDAQQIRILRYIAEQSLDWWAELVNARQGRGTGAARDSFQAAVAELERLERKAGIVEDERFATHYQQLSEEHEARCRELYPALFAEPTNGNGNGSH